MYSLWREMALSPLKFLLRNIILAALFGGTDPSSYVRRRIFCETLRRMNRRPNPLPSHQRLLRQTDWKGKASLLLLANTLFIYLVDTWPVHLLGKKACLERVFKIQNRFYYRFYRGRALCFGYPKTPCLRAEDKLSYRADEQANSINWLEDTFFWYP
jgi:hypothetical protein